MDLCEKRGLFNALAVRKEMVREIAAFKVLAESPMPSQGIQLKNMDLVGAGS